MAALHSRRLAIRVRAFASRVASLALALALLVGATRAGTRYFYCPAMHAVMESSCCSAHDAEDESRADGDELRPRDCCEARRLGALPSGACVSPPAVLDAPLAFVLPARAAGPVAGAALAGARFAYQVRAGPPLLASERQSMLMVFHI